MEGKQTINKMDATKVYSADEIKELAPNYKGKPENFNPSFKKKQKSDRADKSTRNVTVPPPTHQTANAKPTPQKNESMLSEAIFGPDISVTEIEPRQSFSINLGKMQDVTLDVFDAYRTDEPMLDRKLAKEELLYYSTGLVTMRLLEIKAKQEDTVLTSAEKDIRKAVSDMTFNVPQPMFIYLNQIGTYTDKMGKETLLEIPALPTTVVQNFGGYHANIIDENTHNLFEEVPSLGIAGDMVMALASDEDEPIPNFHIALPPHSEITDNLLGKTQLIGERRPEIKQRLAGYGISVNRFDEYIHGTRFNLKYLRSISDIIGKFESFKVEKVVIKNLGKAGGETQAVKSVPSEADETQTWRDRSVQGTSSSTSSTSTIGAAMCFGFQLYKENGRGQNRAAQTANWSCIRGNGDEPWIMPDAWFENRNGRRNLPDVIGTARFRAISVRQDYVLSNAVRRMIKTIR